MAELGLTFFDIGAMIFVVLFLFIGISNGVIREIGKIITWVISLIGAKILAGPMEPIAYEFLGVQKELKLNVDSMINKVDFTSLESFRNSIENNLDSIPFVGGLVEGLTENNWGFTDIYQTGSANMKTDLSLYIMESIEPVAHNVMSIGCFVILFVVLMFVVSIIVNLIVRGVSSSTFVGLTDKLLGGIIGLGKGCIFVVILYSLLFVILSLMSSEYLSVLMDSKFFDITVGIKDILPTA